MSTATAEDLRVMKVRDVAHRLDCDPQTVYALIREGQLRAVKLGRTFRVTEGALAAFLRGDAT